MVKMIVVDLDRTLLNSDKNISEYSVGVLEKCKNRNIRIAIATARSVNSAKRIVDIIDPDIMILNDGALTLSKDGKIKYKKLLSKESTNGIINQCINNKHIGHIAVETETGLYVTYEKANHPDFDYGQIYDFRQNLPQESFKISVEIFYENIAHEINKNILESKLTYNFGENWYRFSHKEVNKMASINIVSEDLQIKLSEIIAFGDDYNDIEMIKGCGTGIAMENGIDELKEVAKYLCGSNDEDGVGKWLEKNVL